MAPRRALSTLVLALLCCAPRTSGLRMQLRAHERFSRPRVSLLELGHGARVLLEYYRARHNNTHAIEYYGDIQVGSQNFTVLFDTGSDQLVVPSLQCVSTACTSHRRYDAEKSLIASKSPTGSEVPDPQTLEFGTGSAMGWPQEDVVCIDGACARAQFLEAFEESDDPFAHAAFDGVLGLSLTLRHAATRKTSVLQAFADAGAISAPIFAVFLAKNLHQDTSEITFGAPDLGHATGPLSWVPLSEPGYWQFSLAGISVGGEKLHVCDTVRRLEVGMNISTFFGRMCCRTLTEFGHEQRCQYHRNYTLTGNRSRYTDHGTVLAIYDDGRVAVRLHDGCVQKIPREWLFSSDGCRGDETIQAVVDTGSSLLMATEPIVRHLTGAIGAQENCTDKVDKGFPTISLALPGGLELNLASEDYMDQVVLADGVYCWPHLLGMPETAKGPALVLGMPFLRAYYSVFDAVGSRLGFARARQPLAAAAWQASKASRLGAGLRAVRLHARRPGETGV